MCTHKYVNIHVYMCIKTLCYTNPRTSHTEHTCPTRIPAPRRFFDSDEKSAVVNCVHHGIRILSVIARALSLLLDIKTVMQHKQPQLCVEKKQINQKMDTRTQMGIVTKMHIVSEKTHILSEYCSSGENFNTTTLSGSFCENVCDLFVHQKQIGRCIHESGNALSLLLLLRLTCWLHECVCVCVFVCVFVNKRLWTKLIKNLSHALSLQIVANSCFFCPQSVTAVCLPIHMHTCTCIWTHMCEYIYTIHACEREHECVHTYTHVCAHRYARVCFDHFPPYPEDTRERISPPTHTKLPTQPLLNVGQLGRIDILQHTATHCNTPQQPQHTVMPYQSKTPW